MNGKLITFEGPEGAGKTTLIERLAQELIRLGHAPLVTREPGGTKLGLRLREILVENTDHEPAELTELLLYEADRVEHLKHVIRPALEQGKIVLCDRFADATVAYQTYGRGIEPRIVNALNSIVLDGLRPDRTYLLDLPVELGLKRTHGRACPDGREERRFEGERLQFHRRVRQGYLELARCEPGRFVVIDAARPAPDVYAAVRDNLLAQFGPGRP